MGLKGRVMTSAELRERWTRSPEDAAALLRAGAEAGLAEAQALYGQILLDGRGVAPDPVQALQWFGKAARAGDAMAANMVGRCYEKGWGAPVDRILAAKWYKAAADAGLDWGMYNYASALGLGAGVAKDEAGALAWFSRAAELGHVKSINFVGAFHEDGRVVARDLAKALDCFRRAAEGGDFRGQFNLARLLVVDGEIVEALSWLAKANETCTAHFRSVILAYLKTSAHPALRDAAVLISRDAEHRI